MTNTLKLELTQCRSCKAWWSLHPYACKQCGSHDLELRPVSGIGKIKAKTTISRAPDSFWRQYVPYTVVLVALQEGVTVMGQADNDAFVGQHVQASIQVLEQRQLVRFNPQHTKEETL
ncbi:Zn-ribbon domain-containing OB-fold protein [Pollutimonas harenae]|uniref:OB-fold domain-containing protein n=1 Tax=Pollutimonas harenae TaxID=657015 RepID=A0A853GVH7_9BURK|nr:OB-fold domain-containing protein [Pollutimonas harenae]NYT86321.1 OB-fold domain-containing protein [Pollutimonas harenae]TEA69921.1 OB-fold domain-containing protein [Pollutimonas harenae]